MPLLHSRMWNYKVKTAEKLNTPHFYKVFSSSTSTLSASPSIVTIGYVPA